MNFRNSLFILLIIMAAVHQSSAQQQINKNGFEITHNKVVTSVTFITDNIVKIVKRPETVAKEPVSLVVKSNHLSHGVISVVANSNEMIASNKMLKIVYDKNTGALKYFLNNKLVTGEIPQSTIFTPVNDDQRSSFRIEQAFSFQKDETIYGFGQHQNGRFNQRSEKLLLRQRNMSIAVPFFQSVKGYGIYWDNYSVTNYESVSNGGKLSSEVGDAIAYYFIGGNNPDAIIKGYRQLTGGVPMLPLWSFGYLQSRERYKSQEELLDVVKKYRTLQVPLDAVIQDWQYWGVSDSSWNAVDFLNPNFSKAALYIDSIHQLNAKVIISVWPSFGAGTEIYKDMQEKNMLFDFYTFPVKKYVKVFDAFNPSARKLYWSYMNKNLFSKGIDGWWLDATEPVQKEILNGNADKGKEGQELAYRDMLTSVDSVNTYIGSFKRYGNLYPAASVQGVYEGQRSITNDKRALILTRSGFAGQQSTGSVLWSGDVTASWDVLKAQIPAALNLTLSGFPYWNSDIGGFFSYKFYPKGLKDFRYQELYIRWLQFAVFTAMMRSHGTNSTREIYQLGKKGDVAYDIAEKYIHLRYQLQPYIYSVSWDVHENNGSLMRPLVMDYANDQHVWNIGNTYLFGKSILVNPVTAPIVSAGSTALDDSSSIAISTYLPQGNWYNFWNDDVVKGGVAIQQNLTLSQIPLFIKAGSIIPIANVPQYSDIKNFKELSIKVYPGKDAEFQLYEDEGDNYNYEKGNYSLIRFRWNDSARILDIDDRKGKFKGMLPSRTFKIIIAGTNTARTIDYNGSRQQIKL